VRGVAPIIRIRLLSRVICCALAISALSAGHLYAQSPPPTDYQVKAAYLSNFGRFVEWTRRPFAPEEQSFNVCILGDDPFGPALDAAVAGESVHRLPLAARRISKVQDAAACRIVFLSSSESSAAKAVLPQLEAAGVLTVSDMSQFTRRGGVIELVLVGNKVRFEINLAAAERAGVTLSSELLKLAVAVRKAP